MKKLKVVRHQAGKDEIAGKMSKSGSELVVDFDWKLCSMTIEKGPVPEEWRTYATASMYKGKGEQTKCKNFKGISLPSVVGKFCARVLVHKVCRVTEGLNDDG